MTEKFYSASELAGKETSIDRTFSENEVEEFSNLFSDYFNDYGDNYSDTDELDAVDIAYNDFFDAYANINTNLVESPDANKEEPVRSKGKSPLLLRSGAGILGGAAGYGASKLLNKEDLKKKKLILEKMSKGTASSSDIKELDKLKSRINTKTALATAGGVAAGVGTTMLASKYKSKNTNNTDMTNFENEDQFSDAFAQYYVENLDTYGDTDEAMEEAYNDFVEAHEGEEGDNYSEMEQHANDFADFYSEMEDIYGDTDEDLDEAYNDFMELSASLEDNYSEDDEDEYSEAELEFIEFYSENTDIYGDTEEGLEEAYNDFMSGEEEDSEYSIEDHYGEVDNFADDFADFYSEMEDIYGDDMEMAFDDYADALENLAEEAYADSLEDEDEFSDEELEFMEFYSETEDIYGDNLDEAYADFMEISDEYADAPADKPGMMKRAGGFARSNAKTAGIGAGIGAIGGLALGSVTDPNSKERKALKAKIKSGAGTDADKAKLSELSKARRNRLLKATGGGAVVGAATGVAGKALYNKNAKFAGGVDKVTGKVTQAGNYVKDSKVGQTAAKAGNAVTGAAKTVANKVTGKGKEAPATPDATEKVNSDMSELIGAKDREFSFMKPSGSTDVETTKTYVFDILNR